MFPHKGEAARHRPCVRLVTESVSTVTNWTARDPCCRLPATAPGAARESRHLARQELPVAAPALQGEFQDAPGSVLPRFADRLAAQAVIQRVSACLDDKLTHPSWRGPRVGILRREPLVIVVVPAEDILRAGSSQPAPRVAHPCRVAVEPRTEHPPLVPAPRELVTKREKIGRGPVA